MARLTMDELKAQVVDLLPDNDVNSITAADLRKVIGDLTDTLTPGYAYLQLVAEDKSLPLTTTPLLFDIWDTILFETPEYSSDLSDGSINIVDPAVTRVTMTIDIEGGTNDQVRAGLYVNGVPTPYQVEIIAQGGGDAAQMTLNALISTEDVGDKIQFFFSAVTGSFDIEFGNGVFICEYVPSIGL